MEPHGEVEVKIRSSLTLALMGVNGQLQASAGLPSESIDYDSVVSRAALKALEKTKTSLSLSLSAGNQMKIIWPSGSLASTSAHVSSGVG